VRIVTRDFIQRWRCLSNASAPNRRMSFPSA
jgi:hypothetical protein